MEEESLTIGDSRVSQDQLDSQAEADQEKQEPSPSQAQPEESEGAVQQEEEEPVKADLAKSEDEPETEEKAQPETEVPEDDQQQQEQQPEETVAAAAVTEDDEQPAAIAASATPKKSSGSKKKQKGATQLKVVLLEGKDLDLEETSKAVTETVVNPAHTETQTLETDFFSGYFYDSHQREHKGQAHKLNQKIFLIPGRQLRAQFSRQEKDSLKEPWKFYYGVKFYVPDPNNSKLLKDDHSRFLYCLQLCDDIRANRVHVDRETAIRLTALMLQGKLGDYDPETCQSGYHNQFPQFQLLPDNRKPDNYEAQLIEVHKAKAGYTPAQTDAEFLSIAKDLPRYGEHLFLAKTMRDSTHADCKVVTIGNGCRGISIYQGDSEKTHVPWKDIVKISYKRDKFRLIYHPPESENSDEEANSKRPKIKTKFYTGPRPQAKRLWKNAVEQHVFFHLESTKTPTIISNFFVRSSMRYSFKKTLPSSKNDPKPAEGKNDRSRDVVPRDLPKGDEEDWFILQHPPLYDPEASKQQEHQKVEVDFKSKQEEDDIDRYIIKRDQIGTLDLVDSFKPEEETKKERTYSLSVVDENSKAATVSVSLNIDPPKGVTLTTGGQEVKGVAIFDSERMPVVNVGSASAVTTGTVIEQDGKQVSTGEHSQKYPLEEVGVDQESNDRPAGAPGGGIEEAEQVNQFLEKEHEKFQKVEPELPPEVEIEVSS